MLRQETFFFFYFLKLVYFFIIFWNFYLHVIYEEKKGFTDNFGNITRCLSF